ncbi:MAG: hypothetical protein ACLPX9_15610 [Rhodomicrobium sp.]
MKNITLAVEDEVLAEVRKYAAAHDTTVNALVRDYLGRLAGFESRSKKAREELLKLAEASTLDLGTWKWNREELYDRHELSRHQHPALSGVAEPGGRAKEGDSRKDR